MIKCRNQYNENKKSIQNAKWRKLDASITKCLAANAHFGHIAPFQISSKPLVTALICNYNYGRFLSQAIDSALAQTWQPLEVLVVDDGSTDESRSILEKYKGRIRVVLKENGGQASAFNVGVAAALGEIICFLDSDDFWYPDKVECTIAKYKEAPWGLVCSDLEEVNEKGVNFRNSTYTQTGQVHLLSGDLRDIIINGGGAPWMFSPTSGMSLPRKIAQKVFPLPEKDWRINADGPLAYGAMCHAPVGVIDKLLGVYRQHGLNNFASTRSDKVIYFMQTFLVRANRYLFLKDYLIFIGQNTSPKDLKETYPYYRYCCFVARKQPWLSLIRLWKCNLHYHFIHSKINILPLFRIIRVFRYLFIDALLCMLMFLHIPTPYSKLRECYCKETSSLSPLTRRYLEND